MPAGHLAHFVREGVCDGLDLSAIVALYGEERGQPPYHPGMMVALLPYAYSRGVYSSRQIARGCEERLDFQAVTALNRPDFRTISDFGQRPLAALAGLLQQVLGLFQQVLGLFQQMLGLCRRAGLVGFGHVALDGVALDGVALKPAPAQAGGTKVKANASKHDLGSNGPVVRQIFAV